jgi:hypothetical protein
MIGEESEVRFNSGVVQHDKREALKALVEEPTEGTKEDYPASQFRVRMLADGESGVLFRAKMSAVRLPADSPSGTYYTSSHTTADHALRPIAIADVYPSSEYGRKRSHRRLPDRAEDCEICLA